MADGKGDIICQLPEVQLHQVGAAGRDQLIAQAPLTVTVEHVGGGDSQITVQVGQVKWPLDLRLPALQSTPHAYMFAMPDNTFYCVLLPYGLPEEDVALWTVVLEETTAFQHQPGVSKEGREELVEEVSNDLMQPGALDAAADDDSSALAVGTGAAPSPTITRIVSGSAQLQTKIAQGADWASKKLMEASDKMQAKYEPNEKPMQVSAATQRNIKLARSVAQHGATGAAKVASTVTDLSARIADSIVRRLGRTQYSEQLGDPNANPQQKRSAIKDVAAASVLAALEVYESMEAAALVVTKAGGDATSGFIHHKYGEQAGLASKDLAATTYSAASTVRSVSQIRRLGATRIAKRVARRTAKGIAMSWVKPVEVPGPKGSQPQQSLPAPQQQQAQHQRQQSQGGAAAAKPALA